MFALLTNNFSRLDKHLGPTFYSRRLLLLLSLGLGASGLFVLRRLTSFSLFF